MVQTHHLVRYPQQVVVVVELVELLETLEVLAVEVVIQELRVVLQLVLLEELLIVLLPHLDGVMLEDLLVEQVVVAVGAVLDRLEQLVLDLAQMVEDLVEVDCHIQLVELHKFMLVEEEVLMLLVEDLDLGEEVLELQVILDLEHLEL
jgi:hypothetical protein